MAEVKPVDRGYGIVLPPLRVYVAVGSGYYGVGVTPLQAESVMLDTAEHMPEVFDSSDCEEDYIFPKPGNRADAEEFTGQALESHAKRAKLRAQFRKAGRIVMLPLGCTHFTLDGMGCIHWEGGQEGTNARLTFFEGGGDEPAGTVCNAWRVS